MYSLNNIYLALIALPAGLFLLIKGADWLVDGAVSIAGRFSISPFIIGATIVAMGTSAPEVAASIAAALKNWPDTAIGNVYGSNISNLALIGGITAMISPILIQRSVIRFEMPAMVLSALLLFPLLADGLLSRGDGVLLLAIFVTLMSLSVYLARRHKLPIEANVPETVKVIRSPVISIFTVIIGLAALAAGADLLVNSAKYIGERIGLSEAVIGLTIVAVGTSLPELVTCVVASLKKQHDISVGNLVGSNIFNTLLVVGCVGAVRPFAPSSRLTGFDFWVMFAVSLMFFAVAFFRNKISRLSGGLMMVLYFCYMGYLFVSNAS